MYGYVQAHDFREVHALDMLNAFKFYAEKSDKGLTPEDYDKFLSELRGLFPEIDEIISDRDDRGRVILDYKEHGDIHDVLYVGTGLKRCLEILLQIVFFKAVPRSYRRT